MQLSASGQSEKAIDLCLQRLEAAPDAATASLLAELAARHPNYLNMAKIENALSSACQRWNESAVLLESVATLRLSQDRFLEAVALYEMVETIEPGRPVTLNNMAIAMAESPMHRSEAQSKIEQAIGLYGRNSQLLDTLGMVQTKLGQCEPARKSFEEALARTNDPRIEMRLIELLLIASDRSAALERWEKLDLQALREMPLVPSERKTLSMLEKTLSS